MLIATKQPVTLDKIFEAAQKIVEKLDEVAPVPEEETRGNFVRKAYTGPAAKSTRPFFDENGTATVGKHKGKTLDQIESEAPDYLEFLSKDPARKEEIDALRAKSNKPY